MKRTVKEVIEVRNGRTWQETRTITDANEVYKRLATDLVAKKVNNCSWIKGVKRTPHYDGYCTITVTYDNNCRSLFTIED